MPSHPPIAFQKRVEIVNKHLEGLSLKVISQTLSISYYTARKWWRRYRKEGWDGLKDHKVGRPTTGSLSSFALIAKYLVLKFKKQHPRWGLDKLRLGLVDHPALQGQKIPQRTTLYKYVKQYASRFKRRRELRTTRPLSTLARAQQAHVCWQMDIKGDEQFQGLGRVRVFMVCDEMSSAPLKGFVYPADQKLTWRDIQMWLRKVFARWGLPDRIRMDRDPLWTKTKLHFPSELALWLCGLGVGSSINRARCPTDNAQIERCNGIWVDHVAVTTQVLTWQQLQVQTDQAWADRRDRLPSRNPYCQGKPPSVAIPLLKHPRRVYQAEHEADLFDMQLVYQQLALWRWQRKVDDWGRISLCDTNYPVSRAHRKQYVVLHFSTANLCFFVTTIDGQEILASIKLPQIDKDFLIGVAKGV